MRCHCIVTKTKYASEFQSIMQALYLVTTNRDLNGNLIVCSDAYHEFTCWPVYCQQTQKIIPPRLSKYYSSFLTVIHWNTWTVLFSFSYHYKFYPVLFLHSRSQFIRNDFSNRKLCRTTIEIFKLKKLTSDDHATSEYIKWTIFCRDAWLGKRNAPKYTSIPWWYNVCYRVTQTLMSNW